MVSVMISHEQGFTEDGLAFAMRNASEQIDTRIFHKVNHCLEVGAKRTNAPFPSSGIGWLGRWRPIPFGKGGRNVPRIPAEFEDIPLRNAEMFEKLPGGMGRAGDFHATQVFGKICEGAIKTDVSLFLRQQIDKVIAQRAIRTVGDAARGGLR